MKKKGKTFIGDLKEFIRSNWEIIVIILVILLVISQINK